MRHRIAGRSLSRDKDHRQALFRNLITELFRHERIETTDAKARAIRAEAERLITLAKRSDGKEPAQVVHARRLAQRRLMDKDVAKKLFETLGPRYKERPGGYTRVYKVGPRLGDAAPVVILELVDREV
jgi:large subunit ribosomal protein L17